MVDDLLGITKCGPESVKLNSIINSFVESKQLEFGKGKCNKIHIGGTHTNCPNLRVHDDEMVERDEEKYLGDIFSKDGTNKKNIEARKCKGFGIISDILSILNDIPLGRNRIDAGLKMRNAMFLNGILTNCEVWYGLQKAEVEQLEEVDEFLLRKILGAHSKTAKEMLYLETGTTPLRFLIQSRRLSYLHHILTRDENELIRRIYDAQKRKPINDDWYITITGDREDLKMNLDDDQIKIMKKNKFKEHVKNKVKEKALNYLNSLKQSHSKVKHIKFNKLEPQKYFFHKEFKLSDIQLLFQLRTRMTDVKINFSKRYGNLVCEFCEDKEDDTQQHILHCQKLLELYPNKDQLSKIDYEDIFSSPAKQLNLTRHMGALLKIRENLQIKSTP